MTTVAALALRFLVAELGAIGALLWWGLSGSNGRLAIALVVVVVAGVHFWRRRMLGAESEA